MAAGLTIRRDRLEEFRERFVAVANRQLRPEDLAPEQRVDLELLLPEVTDDLEQLCRALEPCGSDNPGPVFSVRGIRLEGARVVGRSHLKATLRAGTHALDGIGFGLADRAPTGSGPVDVAFKLERNEFQGRDTLQARMVAVVPSPPAD
jgi:single-stranded-DNA-specific exonuclease